MNKIQILIVVLCLCIPLHSSIAASEICVDIHRNGTISWNQCHAIGHYSVEWSSSPTGEWKRTWANMLCDIPATTGELTRAVPMFYRVVWEGEGILDQEQDIMTAGKSARTIEERSFWQSFTASINGTMDRIDIGFFNTIDGYATLDIYSGQGTNGTLLSSDLISVVSTTSCPSWNRSPVNIVVTNGGVYTFHFMPDPETMPDPYGLCVGGPPSIYSRGICGFIDPSGLYTNIYQSLFKTYVIPEN